MPASSAARARSNTWSHVSGASAENVGRNSVRRGVVVMDWAGSDGPQELDDGLRRRERARDARAEVPGVGDERDAGNAGRRVAAEEHERIRLLDRRRRLE